MRRIMLMAVVTLGLAGCNSRDDTPVNVEENTTVVVENVAAPAVVATTPLPQLNDSLPAERPAPPPAFDDQKQMADDADASGMTARLPDAAGDAPGQTANQTRPAE